MGRLKLLPVDRPAPAPGALPTLEALTALWQEVGQLRLWVPARLGRWLRLRWRMRLTLVDPARVAVVAPPNKTNDCHSCTESCCVGPKGQVSLRMVDVARLMDLGKTALMTHDKAALTAVDAHANPARRRHVGSLAHRIFPVLRQNAFGACHALSSDGSCSLYPHWPLSCARFPYALADDAADVFYSRRCRAFVIDEGHAALATRVEGMKLAAVASYNERIKDALLLSFARDRLAQLGILQHLNLTALQELR